MSTISGLSRIRNKVEEELDTSFIPALIDKAIKHHAGRGIRDCDCSFCLAKKRGTWDVANVFTGPYHGYGRKGLTWEMLPPSDNIDDAYRNFKERAREKERIKLRLILAEKKKEVL